MFPWPSMDGWWLSVGRSFGENVCLVAVAVFGFGLVGLWLVVGFVVFFNSSLADCFWRTVSQTGGKPDVGGFFNTAP